MAILKHIASKNADYGEAQRYLMFQYDEDTMKPVLDENGRLIPREEYHLDGINCDYIAMTNRQARITPPITPPTSRFITMTPTVPPISKPFGTIHKNIRCTPKGIPINIQSFR